MGLGFRLVPLDQGPIGMNPGMFCVLGLQGGPRVPHLNAATEQLLWETTREHSLAKRKVSSVMTWWHIS